MPGFRFALAALFSLLAIGGNPGRSLAAEAPAPPVGEQIELKREAAGKELTVEDAVRNALENHPSIKQARERVGAQAAVLRQQFAAYYPTITIKNTFTDNTDTGLRSTDVDKQEVEISPTFNFILYNFGKREGTVQAARETLSATQYNLKTSADSVVLGVKQAYYSYLQSIALVRVREETVRDRELIVRQAQAFYDVGTRAKIDLVRAQSNLFSAQSDLIAAQNTMRVSWVTLKNAMGLPDLPEQSVTTVTADQVEKFSVTTFPLNLEQARSQSFDIRPELLSFKAQLRAQDQVIATNRRGHLPDLTLDANAGWSNVSGDSSCPTRLINDPTTNVVTSRRTCTTPRPLFPLDSSWQVQLSLTIPVFDGFRTTNKVAESVRTYYAVKAQAEQQRQQVALEVEQGYANLVSAQERIKATRAAEQAARENLELANGRYQVGVGSIIEVTDAQALYVSAEVDYVNSLYNYKIAEAQLLRAVGTP
ncbi:MAG TPA: TolC family protein [Candidatus Binatia bacterium]|jgi:outer membrane protein TolC